MPTPQSTSPDGQSLDLDNPLFFTQGDDIDNLSIDDLLETADTLLETDNFSIEDLLETPTAATLHPQDPSPSQPTTSNSTPTKLAEQVESPRVRPLVPLCTTHESCPTGFTAPAAAVVTTAMYVGGVPIMIPPSQLFQIFLQ